MKLLIDIGNTRTKSAIADGTHFEAMPPVANEHLQSAALWTNIQRVDAIWIASVASNAANDILSAAVADRFGTKPRFARSGAEACGVRNAYANPERLGIDRFLALIAVHASAGQDAVVASCGTALTLDAVDASGHHLGGLIAPSPRLMQSALRKEAARLADAVETGVVEMAADTHAAISSGTWLAAVSLVERFLKQTSIRLNRTPQLWLTGGDSERLGALLAPSYRTEPNLVLRGLALYADAQT
jgi:type III pantothenate kinase